MGLFFFAGKVVALGTRLFTKPPLRDLSFVIALKWTIVYGHPNFRKLCFVSGVLRRFSCDGAELTSSSLHLQTICQTPKKCEGKHHFTGLCRPFCSNRDLRFPCGSMPRAFSLTKEVHVHSLFTLFTVYSVTLW